MKLSLWMALLFAVVVGCARPSGTERTDTADDRQRRSGIATTPSDEHATKDDVRLRVALTREAAEAVVRHYAHLQVGERLRPLLNEPVCENFEVVSTLAELATRIGAFTCATSTTKGAHGLELFPIDAPIDAPANARRSLGFVDVDANGDLSFFLSKAAGLPAYVAPTSASPLMPILSDDGARVRALLTIDVAALAQSDIDSVLPDVGALLAENALDGRVAFAVFDPPDAALATEFSVALGLGVRSRELVRAGVDAALADLAKKYHVPKVVLEREASSTTLRACVSPIQLVSRLAPCMVLRDDALIVAWDRATLERVTGVLSTTPIDAGLGYRLAPSSDSVTRPPSADAPDAVGHIDVAPISVDDGSFGLTGRVRRIARGVP